ncbi:hypothetical protein BDV95DRAFT_613340 [Massariosphaeria phaeospora]|uniref:Uncharacterized protein n=1 Tax=Massariosphaeria phaeospora TaxID=100035 RepID=A0A7C8I587_9PLEO|nr:hypothetical protein BDV95DRAFT_613340 [Massariosphaeria phaeospora]
MPRHWTPKTGAMTPLEKRGIQLARNFRRVVAAWNFDKIWDEQETATIDLGAELLASVIFKHGIRSENKRALGVWEALQLCIVRVLCGLGCHTYGHALRGVTIGYYTKGTPKPKLPHWLENHSHIRIQEWDMSGFKRDVGPGIRHGDWLSSKPAIQ